MTRSRRTVLLVETEPATRQVVRTHLELAGFLLEDTGDGRMALERLRNVAYDVVILDALAPNLDGLTLCRAARAGGPNVDAAIVMVSARNMESERVLGLSSGADDYLTKPFSPKELAARVTALLRRTQRPPAAATSAPQRYRSITIDAERHIVMADGEEVRLTAKEFLLLQYLLKHRGRVLSRDLLLTDVWGYQYTGGTRTVDVHIRRLREKLPVLTDAIQTVKQFGYKLADD